MASFVTSSISVLLIENQALRVQFVSVIVHSLLLSPSVPLEKLAAFPPLAVWELIHIVGDHGNLGAAGGGGSPRLTALDDSLSRPT